MGSCGREARRWESLREDVEHLSALAGKLKQDMKRESILRFRERLEEEAKRSERCNHFFSLLAFRTDRKNALGLYERMQTKLRRSDVVTIAKLNHLKDESWPSHGTGPGESAATGMGVLILLTETDQQGATVAAHRLQQELLNFEHAVPGVAVYPEDSPDPDCLLQTALARAGEDAGE